MNLLKKSILVLSSLSLAACMTTQPPVIKMESNDVYQFNDKASFALNVANMTRKTAGLSDVTLPENAQFKANRGLVATEYVLAFVTDGLLDLAGSMGAQSEADRAFNWKPMLVYLADLDHDNLDSSVVKVVEEQLAKTFDNIEGTEYLGIARSKSDSYLENFMFFFKGGSLCNAEEHNLYVWSSPEPHPDLLDFKPSYNGSCAAAVKVEVAGKVSFNGKIQDVITITFFTAYDRLTDIAVATSGFAVVPKTFGNWGGAVKYTVSAPYVVHDNRMYLFTKDNFSVELK